ncbi:hypothetical protein GCM10027427_26080 [Pseudoclavibacter terrae]
MRNPQVSPRVTPSAPGLTALSQEYSPLSLHRHEFPKTVDAGPRLASAYDFRPETPAISDRASG